MIEKYNYYKREIEEDELDIGKLFSYILSKWKILLIIGIIGLAAGFPIGFFMAQKKLLNTEDLSPSIISQLDNYAKQVTLNEELSVADQELYFMSLDLEQIYYETVLNYTIRTDNQEDIELVSKYMDLTSSTEYLEELVNVTGYEGYINNLKGLLEYEADISTASDNSGMGYYGYDSSNSMTDNTSASSANSSADNASTAGATDVASSEGNTLDDETISQLENAIQEASASGNSDELTNLLSQLNKGQSYAYLTFTVRYLSKDQMDQFVEWLKQSIMKVARESSGSYSGFKLKFVNSSTIPLRQTDVHVAQQEILDGISDRATEIDLKVQRLLTGYATNIASTVTAEGTPAIIDAEDKEKYEEYWSSLTNEKYESHLSKKTIVLYMIIVGVVFGFLAVCWFLVMFFKIPETVDEYLLREDYHLPVLGYVEEGRKKLKGLDKAFARKLHSMQDSSYEYITDTIARTAPDPVVISKTESERTIAPLLELLKKKTGAVVACGDFTSDSTVLDAAVKAGRIYIVVELGITQVKSLEATLQLVEYYGLSLGGIVMI